MNSILDVIEEFGTYGCTNYVLEISLIKFDEN